MTISKSTQSRAVQVGDTVYLAKYAATTGLVTSHVVDHVQDGKYICIDGGSTTYEMGKDAFNSPENTLARAKLLNAKRITSLENQIAELKALEFRVESNSACAA